MSAGARGAAYDFKGHKGFVPCFDGINVVETTGAGDAFSAGFIAKSVDLFSSDDGGLAGKAEEDTARQTLLFASAVGALTCGGEGGIAPQPSAADAERLVREGRLKAASE